jgi:proline utilization trans-activator
VVFALGELYRQHARPKHEQGVPGCAYFESAMELFEDLYEEPTIEYIEAILLIVSSLLSFILCSFP